MQVLPSATILSLYRNHHAALIPLAVTREADLRGKERGEKKDGEEERDKKKGGGLGGGAVEEDGRRRGRGGRGRGNFIVEKIATTVVLK